MPSRKKNSLPMKPLPVPNMNANPTANQRIPHRHVSKMHSIMMLTDSRDRAKPASSAMKPACMKNTRNAVTSTHIVLMGLMKSSDLVRASVGDAPAADSNRKKN